MDPTASAAPTVTGRRPLGPPPGFSSVQLADRAVRSYTAGWRQFQSLRGVGWVHAGEGFHAAYSGLADPEFNELLLFGECDADEVTAVLDRLAAQTTPFVVRARPALVMTAAAIVEGRGMQALPDAPLMALTELAALEDTPGLELRRLGSEEDDLHVAVVAEAFDGPVELVRAFTPPEMMNVAGIHVVGGLLDGHVVTTAFADVQGDAAWIFNVATLDAYRRRGLGSAVSAAATRMALEDDASAVFLLSSPMGERVYARVGFHHLERWASWCAA